MNHGLGASIGFDAICREANDNFRILSHGENLSRKRTDVFAITYACSKQFSPDDGIRTPDFCRVTWPALRFIDDRKGGSHRNPLDERVSWLFFPIGDDSAAEDAITRMGSGAIDDCLQPVGFGANIVIRKDDEITLHAIQSQVQRPRLTRRVVLQDDDGQLVAIGFQKIKRAVIAIVVNGNQFPLIMRKLLAQQGIQSVAQPAAGAIIG
ncbi:hypothetical protein RHECNPAF_430074 [Rhizobium etli CNPAF512]|nr:hypothetical protein RHECNPAF_430074 [Rhizobium etli CNPAF512]